jgi:quercetin dioxygenase-like cupin family protein
MSINRIFDSARFFSGFSKGAQKAPIRSVITESAEAVVVAWQVEPGQSIPTHIHPNGQDTWTIMSGKGEYYLDDMGTSEPIVAGDVVVAPSGCVHGVFNNGDEPLSFISIVTPANAGHKAISLKNSIKTPVSTV